MKVYAACALAIAAAGPTTASAQSAYCAPAPRGAFNCLTTPSYPAQSPYLARSIDQIAASTPAPSYAANTAVYAAAGAGIGNLIGSAMHQMVSPKAPSAADVSDTALAAETQRQIDAFAATHPDFPQYRQYMGAIIAAGRAVNIQDAYILAKYGA